MGLNGRPSGLCNPFNNNILLPDQIYMFISELLCMAQCTTIDKIDTDYTLMGNISPDINSLLKCIVHSAHVFRDMKQYDVVASTYSYSQSWQTLPAQLVELLRMEPGPSFNNNSGTGCAIVERRFTPRLQEGQTSGLARLADTTLSATT